VYLNLTSLLSNNELNSCYVLRENGPFLPLWAGTPTPPPLDDLNHARYAGWIRRSPVLSIRIHESNHNVSVWLKKTPFTIANPFQPESVTLNLLHPDDPSRNKTLSLSLNDHQQVGVENFITSKQLDEYCHSGKYYISC